MFLNHPEDLGTPGSCRQTREGQDTESIGGFGVYRPYALGAGSGCSDDLVKECDSGDNPYALAQRLAEASREAQSSNRSRPVRYSARTPEVTVADSPDLPAGEYYRVAQTPRGSRGITRDRPDKTFPPVVIDIWVSEQTGIPIVVDSWHQAGASSETIGRIAAARDSITFLPGP